MLLNVKKGLLALTLLAAFVSCKKNAIDYQKGGIDESKVYQKPITYDQIELVSNLEKITVILEDLYKEKKNIKEEIVKSGEFVPKGIVIFAIVWFILGGYGLYSLVIKLL